MPTLTGRLHRYTLSDGVIRFALKPLVFSLSLGPVAFLLGSALTHQLNVNPFNAIVRSTGYWSLRFLCLTLAVTPVRWLTRWHPVVKFRRMLGLFAFFYAALHVVAYMMFDALASVETPNRTQLLVTAGRVLWAMKIDLMRPFFAIGWVALALLLPLAATSSTGMITRLGGRTWQTVHRLVYPAGMASVVHAYWPFTAEVPWYVVLLSIIFTLRLGRAYAFAGAARRRGGLAEHGSKRS